MKEAIENSGDQEQAKLRRPTPQERLTDAEEAGRIIKRAAHVVFGETGSIAIIGGRFPIFPIKDSASPSKKKLDGLDEFRETTKTLSKTNFRVASGPWRPATEEEKNVLASADNRPAENLAEIVKGEILVPVRGPKIQPATSDAQSAPAQPNTETK